MNNNEFFFFFSVRFNSLLISRSESHDILLYIPMSDTIVDRFSLAAVITCEMNETRFVVIRTPLATILI